MEFFKAKALKGGQKKGRGVRAGVQKTRINALDAVCGWGTMVCREIDGIVLEKTVKELAL